MLRQNLSIIGLTLLVTACGGDGGGDTQGNSSSLPTIAIYEDRWLMGMCVPTGGVSSVRSLLVVTRTGTHNVSFQQGALQFGGTACQGSGSLAGTFTPLGNVIFSATEGNTAISFNRGIWTPTAGHDSRTIWALETQKRLCLIGDQEPTLFPNVQSVASHLAMLPDSSCYERQ